MTDNKRPALAHDWPLQVPLSEEADAALRGVVEAHLDAFDVALEPFGLSMDDVLLPTWMRAVYIEDVVGFNQQGFGIRITDVHEEPGISAPAPDGVYATDQLADPEPFGEPMEDPRASAPVITPEQRAAFEGARITDVHDSLVSLTPAPDGPRLSPEVVEPGVFGTVGYRPVIAPEIMAKAAAASARIVADGAERATSDPDLVARTVADLKRRIGDHGDPEEGAHVDVPVTEGEPPLRGDLEGSVPTRNLLPLGRQDDCSSGEACGAQCSAVSEPRVVRGPVFGEGAREVHPEPRQDAAVFGAPGEAMSNQTPEAAARREAESEAYRAAVRAEAALERGDRG